MSNSHRPFGTERIDSARETIAASRKALQTPLAFLAPPLRFVAFWAAVTLPFLYLPLLAGGLEGGETLVFGALLAANALTLVLGHGYRAAEAAEE
ncbi:hypothetical protein [Halobellus sp. GM3]|uniref:hypothetical protein n=1 Tax=Halobellus sp. GM3 TaxID=3458410 RepID=UPI00403D8757